MARESKWPIYACESFHHCQLSGNAGEDTQLFPFTVSVATLKNTEGTVLVPVSLAQRRLTVTASFTAQVQCMEFTGGGGDGHRFLQIVLCAHVCMCNTVGAHTQCN